MSNDKTYLCAIVAMTEDRVIGANGEIPWHCPADLKFFKKVTGTRPVIMGRKTYESIPEKFRPLPGRRNIVLTRNEEILTGTEPFTIDDDGTYWVPSVEEALLAANDDGPDESEVFVIGGAEIYRQFLPYTTRLYLTVIEGGYEGDTYFPEWPEDWVKSESLHHPGDSKNPPHRHEIWESR